MNWGDFRTQVRRSILKDPQKVNWSDEALRDFCWWALDTFCAHTAVATSVVYTGATATSYALPENLYESVEVAGLVYLQNSSGTKTFLPLYSSREKKASDITYREWPRNTLLLSSKPSSGYSLVVEYFAYYNRPYADSDTIDVPSWAQLAVGYLIAAYAMVGHGTVAANIGQWDDKTDAGNPEHNPLRSQQQWYMKLYEMELARVPRQDRPNFWKRNQV